MSLSPMESTQNPAIQASANLIAEIVENTAHFQTIRRDIHAHPELCYTELRTADLVANQLQAWGISLHRGLGKTGVIGIIQAGNSERAIGLRADMDALPLQELNQFAHRSQYPGKMHGCGHDGHTAMLLAAAEYLSRRRHFDGTVYLIFQPAEEEGGGARAMIADGLFDQFPMQAVFGMHNMPGLPTGVFAVSPGPVMASSNLFKIKIIGKGCHAAMPNLGLDPAPVAAQIILAFQTILTRNADPLEHGVISITQLYLGETSNVISDQALLSGTVRTFTTTLLDLIETRMREVVNHTCLAFGMTCEFEFIRNYPATVNDAQAASLSRQVMQSIVGMENVLEQQPTMGAEDFAFMLQQLPGSYCFIGNGSGEHRGTGHGTGPCILHNASYDFNDEILPLGATYWVKLVESWLSFDA